MKILITTPELSKLSGVSKYFSTMQNYSSDDIYFFIVGSRDHKEHWIKTVIRSVRDSIAFHYCLRKDDYNIVHLNPTFAWKSIPRDGFFLLIAKQAGTKTTVFFHGWDKNYERQLTGWKLRAFKHIYFKADAMIVLANEFKEKLRFWGYNGPIYTETTMIDDNQIKDLQTVKGSKNNSKNINLLFLARVEKAKGIYETIKAYCLLKNKYSDINLTVAGDGPELTAVQEYVNHSKLENVYFLGYVRGNNKTAAFQNADIYVLPTQTEGMPISVLEAMAFGLPVITRPVGGLKDFFENGKMGFITESNDPNIYRRLIEKLITDFRLREKIGKYNQEYAIKYFAASEVAHRLGNIYREVINSKSST